MRLDDTQAAACRLILDACADECVVSPFGNLLEGHLKVVEQTPCFGPATRSSKARTRRDMAVCFRFAMVACVRPGTPVRRCLRIRRVGERGRPQTCACGSRAGCRGVPGPHIVRFPICFLLRESLRRHASCRYGFGGPLRPGCGSTTLRRSRGVKLESPWTEGEVRGGPATDTSCIRCLGTQGHTTAVGPDQMVEHFEVAGVLINTGFGVERCVVGAWGCITTSCSRRARNGKLVRPRC
jgi:hypothetical protein